MDFKLVHGVVRERIGRARTGDEPVGEVRQAVERDAGTVRPTAAADARELGTRPARTTTTNR